VPALCQGSEVLVAGGIAEPVDDHVGTTARALHGICEMVVGGDHDVPAAVLARDARLGFARDGADHRRSQAGCPAAEE